MPKLSLGDCKYIEKGEKMIRCIINGIEVSSDNYDKSDLEEIWIGPF